MIDGNHPPPCQAMPYDYYPAQYLPADEVLVRVPRQLAAGGGRPLRDTVQQYADQDASADTAYGAAPVSTQGQRIIALAFFWPSLRLLS